MNYPEDWCLLSGEFHVFVMEAALKHFAHRVITARVAAEVADFQNMLLMGGEVARADCEISEPDYWETASGSVWLEGFGSVRVCNLGDEISIHYDDWEELRSAIDAAMAEAKRRPESTHPILIKNVLGDTLNERSR